MTTMWKQTTWALVIALLGAMVGFTPAYAHHERAQQCNPQFQQCSQSQQRRAEWERKSENNRMAQQWAQRDPWQKTYPDQAQSGQGTASQECRLQWREWERCENGQCWRMAGWVNPCVFPSLR